MEQTTKQRSNLMRFLAYVKPYWPYLLMGICGGIIKFTVPLAAPQVTRYLLDHVFLAETLSPAQRTHELFFWVGVILALYVLVYVPGTYIRHYGAGRVGRQATFDLRCDLYDKVMRLSASFFDRTKSGGVVSRLVSDIELAQNLVGNALTNVWMDGTAILVVLYFLLRIDGWTTLVALATFPVYLFAFRQLRRKIQATTKEVQAELEAMSGNVAEKVAGSRVVHAFTHEAHEAERFHEDSDRLFGCALRQIRLNSINMVISGFLTGVAPLLVLLFGGWRVIHGHLSVGELVAVTLYLGPLYLPLQRFTELNMIFASSMAAIDRIFEIMDLEPDIQERPDARPVPSVAGRVTFRNVRFQYSDDAPVLRHVSFTATPGMKVALVGPSGSGKSTLVQLIPRFYDIQEGAIRVDGTDVRDLRVRELRHHIGMVLQDPVLFSGTIRDNIRYGDPNADEAALRQACEQAGALEFIEELPNGFETEVGERGILLSGGQKQRLTIARAFLKNPPILILDEATSALDAETERRLQLALNRLMEGRTTFLVAHRLATVTKADLILVMEHGRIVESGTHKELLAWGGLYRDLYMKQFESAKEAFV